MHIFYFSTKIISYPIVLKGSVHIVSELIHIEKSPMRITDNRTLIIQVGIGRRYWQWGDQIIF